MALKLFCWLSLMNWSRIYSNGSPYLNGAAWDDWVMKKYWSLPKYQTFHISSLILYFCSCFCDCHQCLLDWEVQTWQRAPCHNRWDSAVLLKLVSLRFMHSTLRYRGLFIWVPKYHFVPKVLAQCQNSLLKVSARNAISAPICMQPGKRNLKD